MATISIVCIGNVCFKFENVTDYDLNYNHHTEVYIRSEGKYIYLLKKNIIVIEII